MDLPRTVAVRHGAQRALVAFPSGRVLPDQPAIQKDGATLAVVRWHTWLAFYLHHADCIFVDAPELSLRDLDWIDTQGKAHSASPSYRARKILASLPESLSTITGFTVAPHDKPPARDAAQEPLRLSDGLSIPTVFALHARARGTYCTEVFRASSLLEAQRLVTALHAAMPSNARPIALFEALV